jgi:hypothetical protein
MKKFFSIATAVLLILCVYGSASAYFEFNHLIQSTYETTTGGNEVGTDLGLALSYNSGGPITIDESVSLGDFITNSWADVNVGIFAGWADYSDNGKTYGYVLSTDMSGPVLNQSLAASFVSAAGNVQGLYAIPGTESAVISTVNQNSYVQLMNQQGNVPGSYTGLVTNYLLGEVNLAPLDLGQTVTAHLFGGCAEYAYGTDVGDLGYKGTFTIGVDGQGQLYKEFSAVPIPATAYMLLLGLVGLIGIRRIRG